MNAGGPCNDATGNTFAWKSWKKQMEKYEDELERLKELALGKNINHPIFDTIQRQEEEIEALAYREPLVSR